MYTRFFFPRFAEDNSIMFLILELFCNSKYAWFYN
jgi:hypothetical protein